MSFTFQKPIGAYADVKGKLGSFTVLLFSLLEERDGGPKIRVPYEKGSYSITMYRTISRPYSSTRSIAHEKTLPVFRA